MTVNSNYIEIAKYRGPVSACKFCKNADLPDVLRTFCARCVTNGYTAVCLKCDGSGMIKSIAPWDGKSEHGSVCDVCGGYGVLPAKKPADIDQPQTAAQQPQGITPQPQQATQAQQNVQHSNQPRIKEGINSEKEKEPVTV